MSGGRYLCTLLLCAAALLLVLALALSLPDVEFPQVPQVQPYELRD